jgi:hypothetical protein
VVFAAWIITVGLRTPLRIAVGDDQESEADGNRSDGQRAESEHELLCGLRLLACRFEDGEGDPKSRKQHWAKQKQEEDAAGHTHALFIGNAADALEVASSLDELSVARKIRVMEQLLVKTLWVVFLTGAWLNLGGSALFASKAERDEYGWTWGGAIYLTVITVFAVAMIYFGLTVHWYRS